MLQIADFSDPVVSQKETILKVINGMTHLDEEIEVITPDDATLILIRCLLCALNLCVPVWNAENYGYKGREVIDRIQGILSRTRCRLPYQATVKSASLAELETLCNGIRKEFVDPAMRNIA